MKKSLLKIFLVMLFLLTISFTIVFNNDTNVSAEEITETEEVVEPSLSIYKKNISYSSEIYIMYAVSYEGIDTSANPIKMLFFNTVQEEYTSSTATYVVESQGSATISGVSCLVFASKGLAAKQMTDDIYARAYVEIGEEVIYSEVVKYSVLEYYYEIKEAGTVSTNILNLLEAMINYGAAAQTNFNYNTEKLANATYYKVNVENAVLPDGFTSGRFKNEEQVTLTAPEKEGYVFTGWTNSNGEVVSTEATYTLTVTKDETLTANYEEEIGIILTLTKEAAYDATASTLDLPSTVTFDYNNETVTENVTWDTTPFVVNQIGKQKLYGTLSNDSYKVDELSIEIDVLPYTFSLNEETNEYSITKYYGSAEEEVIPQTFNGVSIVIIGDRAFYGCSSLTNITIPSSVTSIGSSAFFYCSSLTDVYYEGTIESWCNFSFSDYYTNPMCYADHFYMKNEEENWYEVTEIVIPNTITKIGNYQFYGFENVTNIIIPSSVTSIGSDAFSYCSSLTSIGYCGFSNCSSLTDVYYEGTIESWCNITFKDVSSNPMNCASNFYMKNEEDNWYEVTGIEIPNTITKIGDYQFHRFENLSSITIPSSVTSIGYSAFYNCKNLTSIMIPSSVTSIGADAFRSCSSLTSLIFEENSQLTSIASYAFCGCSSLTSITIPNSVTSIGSWTFSSCSSLTSITIPSSVTSIGKDAFSRCSSLASVTIPSSVASIGARAFSYCFSLTDVYYEGTIELWCNFLFYSDDSNPMCYADHFYMKNEEENWYEVTEIVIPNTITEIGNYQFYGFESVTSITISSSVTSIGSYAFYICNKLTDIYYTGTEEEWNAITVGSSNDCLTSATIHYNYVPSTEEE